MDELLPQLLQFPAFPPPPQPLSPEEYEREILKVLLVLNKTPETHLMGKLPNGDDLLDILDPSLNTLPYLFSLNAHITFESENKSAEGVVFPECGGPLWTKILDFIEKCDPDQIVYVDAQWRKLLEVMVESARDASRLEDAIKPLRTAILRMDPDSSIFTSTHFEFAQICFETRYYKAALPILDKDIEDFPQPYAYFEPDDLESDVDEDELDVFIEEQEYMFKKPKYQQVLKYFLYGASIYIGLRNWKKAVQFLENVLVAPTKEITSAIILEAYKRRILLNLIIHGKKRGAVITMVPMDLESVLSTLCSPYEGLAEAFDDKDPKNLITAYEKGQETWQKDHTAGLVEEVVQAYRRFSVIKLQDTYAAITISQIESLVQFSEPMSPEDLRLYICSLISSGFLNATVTQPPSSNDPSECIVRFLRDRYDEPESERHSMLSTLHAEIEHLEQQIEQTDIHISLSDEYTKYMAEEANTEETLPAAAKKNEMALLRTGDNAEDEDVMGDV